jgi:amino acid adenylation domain-containing protein
MKKYPLTSMQDGIMFDYMKSPAGGFYIQQLVCSFPTVLDKDAMHEAWRSVVKENEVLRTRFCVEESGEFTQFYTDDLLFRFDVLSADEIDKNAFLSEQRFNERDFVKDALWSVTLICDDDKTEMVWCFHHILVDGRSHSLIIEDVLCRYNAIVEKKATEESVKVEYHDYLASCERNEVDAEFWNAELSGVYSGHGVCVDECCSCNSDKVFKEEKICFSDAETKQLLEAAEQNSCSVNCLMQSAWALLLHKYSDSETVVFGSTRACRHLGGEDFSTTRGLLINTLPFAVHFDDNMSCSELFAQVKETQLRLRKVEGDSLIDIASSLTSKYGENLFNTILVFENHDLEKHLQGLGGVCSGVHVELLEKVNTFTVAGYLGDRFKLTLNYPENSYWNKQSQFMLNHVKNVLLAFAKDSSAIVKDLKFISEEEKRLLMNEYVGQVSDQDPRNNIVTVIESMVRTQPDSVAVELPDLTTISYRRLNSQANQLANYLISLGYNNGDCIAVCMDRCTELIVSFLAILKAGMTYVPVDTSNTRERIQFYIEDCNAKCILSLNRLSQNIPEVDVDIVLVDRDEYVICKQDKKNLNLKVDIQDVAYILYTSGSTGVPKGVEIYHRGLVSLAEEEQDLLEITPDDRILLLTTPSFDVSIYEIIMALFSGSTICVAAWGDVIPGKALGETFLKREITAVSVTPTELIDTPLLDGIKLRMMICCGEVCTPDIFNKWGNVEGLRFYNAYGPTEVSIWSTVAKYKPGAKTLPIGSPIKDRLCYVLNENLELQPIGVPGELYIGGIGVSKGYLNRPEKNREVYIKSPFKDGDILYKTGDKVRFLSDGKLDYIQRIDNQVKIYGIRFELEEIESLIDSYKQIDKAVVVLLDDKKTIGAYVKTFNNEDISEKEIQDFLALKLQSIFVPDLFIKLDKFPTTLTGKIDRVALKKDLTDIYDQKKTAQKDSLLLSDKNRDLVLKQWNETEMELPNQFSILPIVKDGSLNSSDNIAVIYDGKEFSYQMLEEASNRVANYLLENGIGSGDIVATYIDKSFEYIYVTYGIMKSGAAFLPLSLKYPKDRVNYIVTDAKCKMLITTSANENKLNLNVKIGTTENMSGCSSEFDVSKIESDCPAYVIYTSGSTGKPKGVLSGHLGLLNLCTFYKNRLGLTNSDRAGMVADVSFDASLADIWPYLCVGGSICIAADENTVIDFNKLLDWFTRDKVTVSFISTVLAEMFFVASGTDKLPLRYLLTGGDTLHSFPPKGYPCEVINTYGPTENTVDSTWYVVPQGEKGRPPIGKPIGNVRTYVLNDDLKPVDIGQNGELCLAGNQLAMEYLNRPELTSEKFVTNNIDGLSERVYKTGDVVSWTPNGEIEFYGRSDNQIQICGVRTELGEVEGTMLQYAGVLETAVIPIYDGDIIYALAGFYSVGKDIVFDEDDFKAFLKTTLPSVLVPKSLVKMDSLPKNVAGKLDRKALSVPKDIIIGSSVTEFVFENKMEEKLLPIWSELLCYPSLKPTDNFFDVGGHSILMLKLVTAISQQLNIDIDVSTLMQAPSVRELAKTMKDKRSNFASKYLVDIKTTGNKIPVFCVAGIGGGSHWFRDFANELSNEQPFYCLEFLGLPDGIVRGSVEQVATEFIKAIRDMQPVGPYIIGGFSDGGCVSLEIAQQLKKQGEQIEMFFLIDAYGPNIERGFFSGVKNYIKHFCMLSFKEKMEFFKEKYEWKLYQIKHKFATKEVRDDYDKIWELMSIQHQAVMSYDYKPLDEKIELFRAEKPPRSMPLDPEAGWTDLSTVEINIHITPGDHYSIFKPPHNKEFVEKFEEIINTKNAEMIKT